MPIFQGLKGSDKFLYDLFSRAWPCRFLPVLVVDEERESEGYMDYNIKYNRYSRNVYAFTKQDFNYYTVTTRIAARRIQQVTGLVW